MKKAEKITKPAKDNNSIKISSLIQEFERNRTPIAMFMTLKKSPIN